MRLLNFIFTLSAVILPGTLAQQECAPYTKSPLFHLRLLAPSDSRLNNSFLVSSHSGPPFRQLVTSAWYADRYGSDYQPAENATRFFFNSSTSANAYPCPGSNLGWEWNTGIPDSGLNFRTSRVSNSWIAYFYPGVGDVSVGFDDQGKLFYEEIQESNGVMGRWYRWFVCRTTWASYKYESLVWVVGDKGPDGEGCVSVEVFREFV
ncbi:hypothetical protein QBC43DRAFT_306817 [Cladorrhinum sp. PSN259]|nr:hypothetical protein QBC43DRAFT_306817 [Cladorrhinum sp. PSN259]